MLNQRGLSQCDFAIVVIITQAYGSGILFYLALFFQLSRRGITIDFNKENWTQTNLIHLCNFFSPNFRNCHTVDSNMKSSDLIQGSNKNNREIKYLYLSLPLNPVYQLSICAEISREAIREYILSHNNHDVVIVRLLRMHFWDEASHSHLQTNILKQADFPF